MTNHTRKWYGPQRRFHFAVCMFVSHPSPEAICGRGVEMTYQEIKKLYRERTEAGDVQAAIAWSLMRLCDESESIDRTLDRFIMPLNDIAERVA